MFTLVIPTWNNLPYLRLCVESLERHCTEPYQLVVHVNDGRDGTREWVREQGIEHTASEENIGICFAVNRAAALARGEHLIYLNDDMVAAPGWDTALLRAVQRVERLERRGLYMVSGTMVEPIESGNACVVVADYGRDPARFDFDRFAAEAPRLARPDWLGATWPPTLVPRALWQEVGGYSTEFSPGMSSDNDFSMKLWHAGCRLFLGVGDSLFYHFAKASTGRIRKNDGRQQFLMKWGLTQSAFDRYCLRRGAAAPADDARLALGEPDRSSWGWRVQAWKAALRRCTG